MKRGYMLLRNRTEKMKIVKYARNENEHTHNTGKANPTKIHGHEINGSNTRLSAFISTFTTLLAHGDVRWPTECRQIRISAVSCASRQWGPIKNGGDVRLDGRVGGRAFYVSMASYVCSLFRSWDDNTRAFCNRKRCQVAPMGDAKLLGNC